MTTEIIFSDAAEADPAQLADIRVDAMRASLEAVGRFDPERARNRFLDTYAPDDTRLVRSGDEVIGFFVLRTHSDHLYLDHLYIHPSHQGGGVGRRIVAMVQDQARKAGLPVRLVALGGSRANEFYASCGFTIERRDEFDVYYTWTAS